MKSTLYIAFIAALSILASCTKQAVDDAPMVSGTSNSYIFFEPTVEDSEGTKASLLLGTQLPTDQDTSFGVIGYYGQTSLFGGIARVYRPSAGGAFQYDDLAAWQDATTPHDFYAFYPYSLNASVTAGTSPYLAYTQPTADVDMIDVLTAKTSTAKTDNVPLVFHHRLWALDVEITNSQTSGYVDANTPVSNPDLTIKEIKLYISEFPEKANIPLDMDSAITLGDGRISPELPYSIPVPDLGKTITYNSTETFGTLLFIPVPADMLKYRLEITYIDTRNIESTFKYPSPTTWQTSAIEFKGGRVYSLTVNKTNDTFFEVELENSGNWTDVTVDHTFN